MSTTENKFLSIKTKQELSSILGLDYHILTYNLYKLTDDKKYVTFKIKKRGKGYRNIIAPDSGIKYIQELLLKVLTKHYPVKNCVHGFVESKSIKTNAQLHVRKKIIVNIDLQNFFPSINFGRVKGVFESYPFNFNDEVSTTIAQICCYKGILPQGAPTSPIISNFICRKLDNELIVLSKKGRFHYTRYADDLTFSTNILPLPKEIGTITDNKLKISSELLNVINSNGFSVNNDKIRFSKKENRQEVTGLIVNDFINVRRNFIRQIRAMLNAWEKYGIYDAAREHFDKYNYKGKKTKHIELSYLNEIVGKISYVGMIRGKDDIIYQNLLKRIKRLNPNVKLSIIKRASEQSDIPILYGEGKTDWKHIKAALDFFKKQKEFLDLDIQFETYEDGLEINNIELLKICEITPKTKFNKSKVICLFDRDYKGINYKVVEFGKHYKYWGNNVYSVLLPIPKHRGFEEVCIEHYYNDKDLTRVDKNGRRIFLSTEFDPKTGNHLSEKLTYPNTNYLKSKYPRIIDNKVFDIETGKNKALKKDDFAKNIIQQESNFSDVSFESFKELLLTLDEIVKK
ncbi:MAG: reverse transcriptase domain-containing protein [Lutibacter sp.]|nr:reverse transcriptase domain-containing protein [Lutibacter sp.]